MGASGNAEIEAWLNAGGLVVAASDRAARVWTASYHLARREQGLTAWAVPNILEWKSFLRAAWQERVGNQELESYRLLLNSAQEQALWAEIAGRDGAAATLLEAPRYRIASLAIKAHELLCSYAPHFLHPQNRSSWQQDEAAFSGWLAAFEEVCQNDKLLAPSRLPLELTALLKTESGERPALLLVGFDRILPAERELLAAWGDWREAASPAVATDLHFYQAADLHEELTACALWCGHRLTKNPDARLLVLTQDASTRRGEFERAFGKHANGAAFEFSLGVPLLQVALARSAFLLLRWLKGELKEAELDWLLSTGYATETKESSALEAVMRSLRRQGLERTEWSLAALLGQCSVANPLLRTPIEPWMERMTAAQNRLESLKNHRQTPFQWAETVEKLLEIVGWPGSRSLSSAEMQAHRRWQQAVEAVASLGFQGRRVAWSEFLSMLHRVLEETLFAPESHAAPIQIAGPAESAGLSADAIWFLGANESAWPASGALHPLLPRLLQRTAGMPHATAQLDWDLADAITRRLLRSAPELHFSYARQSEGSEARPSRLIAQFAGKAEELPPAFKASYPTDPIAVTYEDRSRVPFLGSKAEGGASVLTAQSQCPFQSFARARLAAKSWSPAQNGLTASQRGQLLHAVLHAVWSGPPEGIRSHDDLLQLADCKSFVAKIVPRVLSEELRPGVRETMPRRYLELEAARLARLVTEWLDYEKTRISFEVVETEGDRTVSIAGMNLNLRLDRADRLNDGSLLVIDYKSGDVSPSDWNPPRPEDVQLPLYAGFALEEELGGLVYAKVRAGNSVFAGRIGDAKATLIANLSASSNLVKNPLTVEQLLDWRDLIEQLAQDFLAGKAEVDPRDAPKTCKYCSLQTLCRIQEHSSAQAGDELEELEVADE